MHRTSVMPTTIDDYNMHDHAGARWLAPFLAVLTLTLLMTFLMMVYPHTGA
jgi:hypothetical protein